MLERLLFKHEESYIILAANTLDFDNFHILLDSCMDQYASLYLLQEYCFYILNFECTENHYAFVLAQVIKHFTNNAVWHCSLNFGTNKRHS